MDDELTRTFGEFDGDGDGLITEAEFRSAMNTRSEPVTDADVASIFAHADTDGDGRIDLAEFTKAWNG